jgi:hypothetical protein
MDPDDNLLAHAWDFGDGQKGKGTAPVHVYERPGIYNATLTATDQDGRTGRGTAEVRIVAGVNRDESIPVSDVGFARERAAFTQQIIRRREFKVTYYG